MEVLFRFGVGGGNDDATNACTCAILRECRTIRRVSSCLRCAKDRFAMRCFRTSKTGRCRCCFLLAVVAVVSLSLDGSTGAVFRDRAAAPSFSSTDNASDLDVSACCRLLSLAPAPSPPPGVVSPPPAPPDDEDELTDAVTIPISP